MNLRPRNGQQGFYTERNLQEKNKINSVIAIEKSNKNLRKPRGFNQVIENLSCLISKKIIKANSHINIRLDLRDDETKYIAERYNVTKRYKYIPDFLTENIPITFETSLNNKHIIDKEGFMIKFSNDRKGKQIINNKEIIFRHSPQLVVEFRKRTVLEVNQFYREILEDRDAI